MTARRSDSSRPVASADRLCVLLLVAVIGVSLVVPNTAAAEEPDEGLVYAEPSAELLGLNDRGVELMVAGNYARAAAMLEQARMLGEVNIVYLNLGRAYHKLGNCAAARRAYEDALTAPPVRNPPPELVDMKAGEYLQGLDETCAAAEEPSQAAAGEPSEPEQPATESSEPEPEPDPDPPTSNESSPAPEAPEETDAPAADRELAPGPTEKSEAVDSPADPPSTQSAPTTRRETGDVELATKAKRKPKRRGHRFLGWTAVTTGIVFGLGAGGLKLWASGERQLVQNGALFRDGVNQAVTQVEARNIERRANTLDSLSLAAAQVGGVALGAGIFLLITAPEKQAAGPRNWSVGTDGRSVSCSVKF